MLQSKFFKVLMATAAVAFGATVAVISLTTTTPPPAHADIPPTMIEQDSPGHVPSLAPMLKKVLPAVVNISVSGEMNVKNPLMQDPFFRQFFNLPQQESKQAFQAIGSGVIVDAKRGYILTNNHVVANANDIKVTLRDGRTFKAKLVGRDPETDIAVLKIKAQHITALPIANSSELQVGDFVVAVGDPFGLGQTVTSGIVSALGRVTNMNQIQNFIQTDASINPGNSGGALVNLKGQLVGINSEILTKSGGNMGIGFAIPTDLAVSVMKDLIKYGKVQHGEIGVIIQNLTPELAKALGVNVDHGVVVARVIRHSPAEKAGLKPQDVIVAANGKKITNALQLRDAVGLLQVGQMVKLKVIRNGEMHEITVKVGSPQKEVAVNNSGLFPSLRGASYSDVQSSNPGAGMQHGILVSNIRPGSPAQASGLQNNDVIVSVNRHPVNSVGQFDRLASDKQSQLLLRVIRGNSAFFLLLTK